MSVYALCKSTLVFQNEPRKAQLLAEKAVQAAAAHTNEITDDAVLILQRLRDDFMTLSFESRNSADVGMTEREVSDIERMLGIQPVEITESNTDKIVGFRRNTKDDIAVTNANPEDYAEDGKRWQLFNHLRSLAFLHTPVLIDDISSSKHVVAGKIAARCVYQRCKLNEGVSIVQH
jgi:hypothetical protein